MKLFLFYTKKLPYFLLSFCLSVCIIFFSVWGGIYLTQKHLIYPLKYGEQIIKFADKFQVERALVFAVVKVESGFDKDATSGKNAKGLMQITDDTAEYIAGMLKRDEYDVYDVETNIEFGCYYLNYLFTRFDKMRLVVIAYNAGEGNLSNWLSSGEYKDNDSDIVNTPFKETNDYVGKIEKSLSKYRKIHGKVLDK